MRRAVRMAERASGISEIRRPVKMSAALKIWRFVRRWRGRRDDGRRVL